jgi:HlyD family secretion protein
MKRKNVIILVVVALVIVAAATLVAVQLGGPKGTTVRTAQVVRRDLASLVTANGAVEARTKVDISANIMGQITRLNVEEGQPVRNGDLLLVIDQVRYTAIVDSRRSALRALEADLARAREAAAQAQRDLERAEKQYREEILPAAEYDRIKSLNEQSSASVQSLESQVGRARAELASVEDELGKTEIRAPIRGIVTRLNVEQGEVVVTGTMNNPGTVLMTISDLSTIEAVLEVDQTDIPLLRIGQPATVLIDAYPATPFTGSVTEIGSSPIQGASVLGGAATGTDYEVTVTLDEVPEGIRPGLTVTADIITATKQDTLTVPIGALVLREEREEGASAMDADGEPRGEPGQPASVASRIRDVEGVYVVEGGTVSFRPVTTGIKGELEVEVVDGVEEGIEIVVGPFKALRELEPGGAVVVDNSRSGELEM